MQRLIVCSDIHGFYDELMKSLNKVEFNPEKDIFIHCGDALDRGPNPRGVIEFFNSLPNKVLIKGNHESLMQEAIKRKYFLSHDIYNGTAYTAYDFCIKENAGAMNHAQILGELRDDAEYQKYINSLVDYYETEKYVFAHAWVPKNWRTAHYGQWEKVRWYNPFDCAAFGYNKTGKIIVHGHYHNSYWWSQQGVGSEWDDDACFDICEHDGCIGLDACTALSGKVNVLVVEDRLLDEVIE